MTKIRTITFYKHYFEEFIKEQTPKVQDKIYGVLLAITTLERIPSSYLKHIEGTKGLYEARIQLGSSIWRVFCFFDDHRLIVLLNGFQKKTEKTPRKEIEKAMRLMDEYYHTKHSNNGSYKLG
ncbi:type II toxin-antitoxin system RelE/ParE family toxin [Dyadobacter chenhuakuii]|uniref:Type II toxin-antitoxin system RelE/ParE family toxin n=1 Tax=Dyadobacter chenhuakuii TaxID=2909339 RepID=A0ABY4XRW3_9BACT|nr:type II toxin-antitoxin system RelE/ParE family toxin [Dyadobacter chenhuakuii]MCF2492521.1 type II toxin-antitoxin system RelE/ParE family toxin [Dyadobacter chenhuakuii]USJ33181.1 type II toxin-antitoxin system RelE/ParE family toxin [Dyadobacter chenhuakuii]